MSNQTGSFHVFSPQPICVLLPRAARQLAHLIRPGQYVRRNPPILDFRFSILDHRITRSALAKTFGGTVNPICFAVFRLITSSNFVGCSTGRSAGFAPFRILSTYVAARRKLSPSLVA